MTNTYEIRIGNALREAWEIFLKGPEVFICIAFAAVVVSFSLSYMPGIGQIFSILVYALGPAAIYLAAESGTAKESVSFQSVKGIVPILPQLLTLCVVKSILITVGFFLFILPGLYLMVTLVYAELFVVVRGLTFIDALKASHELARANLLGTLGLGLFLLVLAWSGILLVGIGVLLTAPLAMLALYSVFRRVSFRAA